MIFIFDAGFLCCLLTFDLGPLPPLAVGKFNTIGKAGPEGVGLLFSQYSTYIFLQQMMALSLRAMSLNTATLMLEVACTTVSVEHAITLFYLVGDESVMPVRIQVHSHWCLWTGLLSVWGQEIYIFLF